MAEKPTYEELEQRILELEKSNFKCKQVEKSLQLTQFIFDKATIGIYLISSDGRILNVNKQVTKSLGYTKDELSNMTIFDIDPTLNQQNLESLWECLCSKKCNSIETVHKHKEDKIFPVEVITDLFEYNGEKFSVSFVRDITERKRAEEALLLTQFSFDRAAIGIFRIGIDAQILNVNEQACKDLDYSASELCQMTIFDINPTVHVNDWDNIWQKLCDEKVFSFETEHRRKDGTISPVEITSNLLEFGGNQYSFSFVRDITEKKHIEKHQAKMESHLQQIQRLDSLGTLAGGIAHDFNNILFPILGHAQMLLEDNPEDSPLRKSINQIYTGALRARDLVHQILIFSSQGKRELKLMKMQSVIKEALKLIRATIPTTISINQNLQPSCGAVTADPIQIHQIVMNLVTNAYHAMENTGGELNVELKEIQLDEHELCNGPQLISPVIISGPYACLKIADSGKGMDKKIIDKIFEPFFTTKEKGKGTGLGLSVVHGIVKKMNGVIQVHSELGKGTEFHIYLPIIQSAFEAQDIQAKEPLKGGAERVLLVDDEDSIIAMEKQILERLGYHVTSRTSSIEALEAFRVNAEKFDIVISDMAMPKLSGDKLAVELIRIRPDIPVLLCSGFSEAMPEEKVKSIGAKGLLMKPILMQDLAKKIREVLDKK